MRSEIFVNSGKKLPMERDIKEIIEELRSHSQWVAGQFWTKDWMIEEIWLSKFDKLPEYNAMEDIKELITDEEWSDIGDIVVSGYERCEDICDGVLGFDTDEEFWEPVLTRLSRWDKINDTLGD